MVDGRGSSPIIAEGQRLRPCVIGVDQRIEVVLQGAHAVGHLRVILVDLVAGKKGVKHFQILHRRLRVGERIDEVGRID